jgi:hypothetical protein
MYEMYPLSHAYSSNHVTEVFALRQVQNLRYQVNWINFDLHLELHKNVGSVGVVGLHVSVARDQKNLNSP